MPEVNLPELQPLAIDAKALGRLLSVSLRKINSLDSAGKLPRPVVIGARSRRWRFKEIDDWIQANCPDRATWEALKNGGKPER